jgi:hypothetical protein
MFICLIEDLIGPPVTIVTASCGGSGKLSVGMNTSADLVFDTMGNIFTCAFSAPFLLSTEHNIPQVRSNHWNIKQTEI